MTEQARQVFQPRSSQDISQMLERLSGFHDVQLQLCESLEKLADGLPEQIDRQNALYLARMIGPMVRRAHAFEEEALFPVVRTLCPEMTRLKESLERLQYEHWGDEAFADELGEAIIAYVADARPADAEKLAYMLRGFFESMRRHIAFESEHLVPMVSANISTAARLH